jgi:photosystem II stability/assembly factor-like uncharacterized protein
MKKVIFPILSLFLVSCSILQAPPTPTPTRSPVPTRTPTLTATSSPIPSATLSPTITPTPLPGMQISLVSIKMYDLRNGWGVDSQGRILKTADGGSTWLDAAPGKYTAPNCLTFYSVDIRHAWFVETDPRYGTGCQQAGYDGWSVWYTRDGGASWTASPKTKTPGHTDPVPTYLYFADQGYGWSLVQASAAMGHGDFIVYQSLNGGANWSASSMTYASEGYMGWVPGTLWFTDAQNGWRTSARHPFGLNIRDEVYMLDNYETSMEDFIDRHFILVDHTIDGGVTWAPQVIAAPDQLQLEMIRQQATGFMNHSVVRIDRYGPGSFGFFVAFGTSESTLDSSVSTGTVDQLYCYFYISFNSGKTYRIIPVSPDLVLEGRIFFLNPSLGWRWVNQEGGRTIERTTDGGVNWEIIAEGLPQYNELQFTDADHGWTVEGSILMVTADGGQTWTEIVPALVSP